MPMRAKQSTRGHDAILFTTLFGAKISTISDLTQVIVLTDVYMP